MNKPFIIVFLVFSLLLANEASSDVNSCTLSPECNIDCFYNEFVTTTLPPVTTTLRTTTTTFPVTTTLVEETTTTLPPPKTEIKTIPIIVPNQPLVIDISNPNDIKFEKIEIQTSEIVNNVEISFTRTYEKPSTVTFSAVTSTDERVYVYLTVDKTNVNDNNIKNATIRFKVEKEWIINNNVDASFVVLKRYENVGWKELSTQNTGDDDIYAYYEAASPGLSVFAITAKRMPTTTSITPFDETTTTLATTRKFPSINSKVLILIAAAIIIPLLAVLFAIPKTKKQPDQSLYYDKRKIKLEVFH